MTDLMVEPIDIAPYLSNLSILDKLVEHAVKVANKCVDPVLQYNERVGEEAVDGAAETTYERRVGRHITVGFTVYGEFGQAHAKALADSLEKLDKVSPIKGFFVAPVKLSLQPAYNDNHERCVVFCFPLIWSRDIERVQCSDPYFSALEGELPSVFKGLNKEVSDRVNATIKL